MTIEMEGRDKAQPECRQPGQLVCIKFSIVATVFTLSVSGLPLMGYLSAHAAEITYRCINPASGTIWNLKIDDERQTAGSLPAEISATQTIWHDIVRGGSYELDRKTGLLTFRNASSTGGYMLYYRCHEN